MLKAIDIGALHHVGKENSEERQGRLFMALSLARKKDDSWRLCADCFALNSVSRKQAFPCSYQDLRSLALRFNKSEGQGKTVHILDMEKFYWQFNILPECRHLVFIVWRGEILEFTVLPFGWTIAPFLAQFLHELVAVYLNKAGCESNIYIDDALYRGNKSLLIRTYNSCGLSICPKKSTFDQLESDQIAYLGVGISLKERFF